MIPLLLRLPLVAFMVASLAWTWTFWGGPRGGPAPELTGQDLSDAFPDAAVRGELVDQAWGWVERARAWSPSLPASAAGPLLAALLHAQATLRLLPYLFGFLLAGGVAGLVLRERIRFDGGYASPTAGFAARMLVASAALYVFLFATTPIPAPYWGLHAAGAAAFAGAVLYTANLPIRL